MALKNKITILNKKTRVLFSTRDIFYIILVV